MVIGSSPDVGASYQEQRSAVTAQLAQACDIAGRAIILATRALVQADLEVAERAAARQQAVRVMSVQAEKAVSSLAPWRPPTAANLRSETVAIRIAADLKQMGALAAEVAIIARRRYPQKAVPDELSTYFTELGALAAESASHARDVLSWSDHLRAERIHCGVGAIDRLHHRLPATPLQRCRAPGVAAGVDPAVLVRLYEEFAEHAVRIGDRARNRVADEDAFGAAGSPGFSA